MHKKSGSSKLTVDKLLKRIHRKTRQTFSAEETIKGPPAGEPL